MTAQIASGALYYDQFKFSDAWQSPYRTITETDALMFAGLTGDLSVLAFDRSLGTNPAESGRGVNAACSLALATGLEQRLGLKEGTGLAFLSASWNCHQTIYAGQSVRIEQTVVDKRPTRNKERGIVLFDVRLVNSQDRVLCQGKWTLMIRRDPTIVHDRTGEPGDGGVSAPIGPIHAGQEIPIRTTGATLASPGRTVTEADIGLFCALTGDYNPAHSDAEFARSSPFGRTVLQGPAALAIGVGLTTRLEWPNGQTRKMVGIDWTFMAPVFAGDTVRVVLTQKIGRPSAGAAYTAVIYNQRNQPVQSGDWLMAAQ